MVYYRVNTRVQMFYFLILLSRYSQTSENWSPMNLETLRYKLNSVSRVECKTVLEIAFNPRYKE